MMVFIILAIAVVLFVFVSVIILYFIAMKQFNKLLVRTDQTKWGRSCSDSTDEEQVQMYKDGLKWGQENSHCMEEISIVNDGFKLVGQYFDFGYNRAVIIIAGRTEGCTYSYYYAPPYQKSGYNVLVIDNRAHGLSDGKYNCLGLKEYTDILAWGEYLYTVKRNTCIVCHGVCIGSATAMYALTDKNCPNYMTALVADGMYTTFGESFREHLIQDKHPVFPFMALFFMIFKHKNKVDAVNNGPIYCMPSMTKRILFLHSREDLYSLPAKTYAMYQLCPSENKKFVWFDKGRHSFVRFNNKQNYDQAIMDFLKTQI